MSQKIACIIPARLASTRFPKKILASLCGKPILQWIWEAATACSRFDEVLFAIDSEETAQLIESFGGKYAMTSTACASGTDRLVEVMQRGIVQADVWVNWQGDEPFITKQMIEELLQSVDKSDADLWTLKKLITKPEDVTSPHIAKLVCDDRGNALYFSRSPIPYYRDEEAGGPYYKHVGLYAYTTAVLQKIAALPPNALEEAEKLEQLRFLCHGITIKVHETSQEVIGIDRPVDLQKAEMYAARVPSAG